MWPDRVSNPRPLTYESGALLTALRGPATLVCEQALKTQIRQLLIAWVSILGALVVQEVKC